MIRAIDDGKRSGLNLANNAKWSCNYDVDTLAALTAAVAEGLQSQSQKIFDVEDGSHCEVPVHPDVRSDSWVGRALDLSSEGSAC